MQPLRSHTGIVVPLDRNDVDTDQIIPKQFLKRIERTGYGDFLFYDWRMGPDGRPDMDFVLNQSQYAGASILLAGSNFGCGSSREHAAWALRDFGIRVVVAPSFADIFLNNAVNNGLAPLAVPAEQVAFLMARSRKVPGYSLCADLESLTVSDGSGFSAPCALDDFHRRRLLEGLDDIGLSLACEAQIAAFEVRSHAGHLRPARTK